MGPVEQALDEENPFRVTGVMMQYHSVCDRELWFEYHGVSINKENSNIVRGEIVDNNSYSYLDRERVRIGPIAPDMLEDGKLVEIKPSSKIEESSEAQLLYYLWYFEEKLGIKKEGVLSYPSEKTREEYTLTQDEKKRVEDSIREIHEIVTQSHPPRFERKPVCSSCAFKDFCMVGIPGDNNE